MDPKLGVSVAAGAYIIDPKGRILLIRAPHWHNQYMIPGGHIEYGESIFDTVKREVKEEVGLDIEPMGVIIVAEDIFPKGHVSKMHYIYFDVICKPRNTRVKLDKFEATSYVWAEPEKALRMVKHRTLKRGISEYIKQKKEGFNLIDIS
ncbi:MAG: NUDIX domain-containing protein [Candidatus Micrarchaeota archaeon]|nr:NUDIX domain-containing protein [Candidatus Micrarchaeota archaeon]MDE1834499.1 NUDIX domain-containing protein [Candidatus Micrarchaeota archaeon]MDE1859949.1 NUDIX domain-containing protein [Candidatus Micrarchaeota archaeon]